MALYREPAHKETKQVIANNNYFPCILKIDIPHQVIYGLEPKLILFGALLLSLNHSFISVYYDGHSIYIKIESIMYIV